MRALTLLALLGGTLSACKGDTFLVLKVLPQVDAITYRIYDDPECSGAPFAAGADTILEARHPEEGTGSFPIATKFGLPIEPAYQGKMVRLELEARSGTETTYWCACPQLPKKDAMELPVQPLKGGQPRDCMKVYMADVRVQYDPGHECTSDFNCAGGNCECEATEPDPDHPGRYRCKNHVCAEASCTCSTLPRPGGHADAWAADCAGGEPYPPGTYDPFDCGGQCGLGGQCLALRDGDECSVSDASQCPNGYCACADESCSLGRCHESGCGECEYDRDGFGACAQTPEGEHGTECTASSKECDSFGRCRLRVGEACTGDSECASGNCECQDASCRQTICSQVDCDCQYTADGSYCAGPLDSGQQDHELCRGEGRVCRDGGCEAGIGALCYSDPECALGSCDCADDTCSTRKCRDPGCGTCWYYDETQGSCAATPAGNRGTGCVLADQACNDSGQCRAAAGSGCADDAECGSSFCECADAACTSRKCHESGCATCRYDADGIGPCALTPAGSAGEACVLATEACDGLGACKFGINEACTDNAACGSGHCACANLDCSTSECHQVGCSTCEYDIDGVGGCSSTPAGFPGENCATGACDGAGVCKLANGTTCAQDSDCGSGFCECADATCSGRKCHESGCPTCRYDADGRGACTPTPLGNRGEGCATSGAACDASGACKLADGASCTQDSACARGWCECADADCSGSRRCHESGCAVCSYDADGVGACTTTPAGNQGEGCLGLAQACDGNGLCKKAAGQICTTDNECGSGSCECADADCSSRKCHESGCATCYYDADGVGACAVTPAGNQGESCVASTEECDGAGACKRAAGQTCSTDSDCGRGSCECADANCSGPRVCHESGCATCTYDADGLGACTVTPAGNQGEGCVASINECDGAGVCKKAAGQTCTQGSECGRGFCECADATCSSHKCHESGCATCQYDADGRLPCAATPTGNKGENCTTESEACGSLGCMTATGYACVPGQCAVGTCSANGYCCAAGGPCVYAIDAGATLTTATVDSFGTRTWGSNLSGQLGIGTFIGPDDCSGSACSMTPVAVGTFQSIATAAGTGFACAMRSSGASVWCWGAGGQGQIGNGQTNTQNQPVQVALPTGVLLDALALSAGSSHACAVLQDLTVACWGNNNRGQLGNDPTTLPTSPTPVRVCSAAGCPSYLQNVTGVSAGDVHTCAVLTDYSVWCWGRNADGQLGNNSTSDSHRPVQALVGVDESVAGSRHTCARMRDVDRTVKCWGYNAFGQVGNGSTSTAVVVPVSVCGESGCPLVLTEVDQLSAGGAHTCAVRAPAVGSRTLYCWGENAAGQLGNGSYSDQSTPAIVGISATPLRVATGSLHTCTILTNGNVRCWGDNIYGQLGDGTRLERLSPVPVNGPWPP